MNTDSRIQRAREIPVRELWLRLGLGQLPPEGRNVKAPWRVDHSPSVAVGGKQNTVHDFGTGEDFDSIALVQKVKYSSFPDALNYLLGPDDDQLKQHSSDNSYHTPKKVIKATYPYHDEDGNFLYEVLRFEPKAFAQRRRGDDGEWIYKLDGVHRVLYRLPELLTAINAGQQVFIVEGEKDSDNLHKLGLPSTTCAQGAGKWKPEYSTFFRGSRVAILPDNDEAGRHHANSVARSLQGIASEVKVLELPGLPPKCDVSDWLSVGHTREELKELVSMAPVWEPKACEIEPSQDKDRTPKVSRTTDLANSERFVTQHGVNVRYCYSQNSWLVWNGRIWQRDADGEVTNLAKETVRSIYHEAAKADTKQEREEISRHARTSESRRAISDLLTLAQSERGISVRPEGLDCELWRLPLLNGTYDLREDRFREHRREDYFTRLAPVSFDGEADCPRFLTFLNNIMSDFEKDSRNNLISFLQRLFGICLTGDVGCQKLFILWGGGQNGKSTLIQTMLGILGPFATRLDTEIIMAQKYSQHPTGLSDLYGARLAWTAESGDGRRLAEDLVKSLTGGDRIRARRMRENFFEWSPTHKLLLLTNHKPRIHGRDLAIWRRICLIPFIYKVPLGERILNYENVLLEERSGILNWMIDGLRDYQERGLSEPREVQSAVEAYQTEEDVLAPWLEERCLLGPDYHSKAAEIWNSYSEYCNESATEPVSKPVFWRMLSDRGIIGNRTKTSRLRDGIGLRVTER